MAEGKESGTYQMDDPSIPGAMFSLEISDPLERVQAFIDAYKDDSGREGFAEDLMRNHLRVVRATTSPRTTVVFEMKVTPAFSNLLGSMHGGAVALVYDMCTTAAAAPLARKGFWQFGGVSRVLSVTYLRPIKVGMVIRIECEVLQIGARLATIRGVMTDKVSDKVLSVAEHNKASIDLQSKSRI